MAISAGQVSMDLTLNSQPFEKQLKNAINKSMASIDVSAQLESALGKALRKTDVSKRLNKTFKKAIDSMELGESFSTAINKGLRKAAKKIDTSKVTKEIARDTTSSLSASIASTRSGIFSKKYRKNLIGSLSTTMHGFGRSLKNIIYLAISTGLMKTVLDYGSQMQEIQNIVDVTFREMSKSVDDFASTAITKFGLTTFEAKKFTGYFGAMAKSAGFSTEKALEMATTLTGLTGDLASFYDLDREEAYTKLAGVFTGETKGLKGIGIAITENQLNQYALAKGIKETTRTMTEQEKVLLRYESVLAQAANAVGDFVRTEKSFANQTRITISLLKEIAANIGQGIISAITPAIRAINLLLTKLNQLSARFKNYMQEMFGKQEFGFGATDATAALQEALGNAGEEADKTKKKLKALLGFDEINRLSDNDDSESASSALNDGGFSLSEALGGSKGGKDDIKVWDPFKLGRKLGTDLKTALDNIDWDGIKNKSIQKIRNLANFLNGFLLTEGLFSSLGSSIANFLNIAFDGFYEFATTFDWKNFGLAIADGIKGFFTNFNATTFGNAIGAFVEGILDMLIVMIDQADWNIVGTKIGEALAGIDFWGITKKVAVLLWKSLKGALASWKGTFDAAPIETAILTSIGLLRFTGLGSILFGSMKKGILKGFSNIGSVIAGFFGKGGTISKIFSGFFSETGVIALVKGGAGKLGEAMTAVFGGTATTIAGVGSIIVGAIAAVGSFIDMLKNGFSWVKEIIMIVGVAAAAVGAVILGAPAAIAAAVAAVVASIGTLIVVIKDNWQTIKEFFINLGVGIKDLCINIGQTIGNWWTGTVIPLFEKAKIGASNLITTIKNFFVNGINSLISKVTGFITNIISIVKNAKTTLVTAAQNIVDGIKEKVVGGLNSLVEKVKSPINRIISMINNMIDKINTVSFDIPNWVPAIGGKTLGFNIPKLPMLATGGVVEKNTPQPVIVGDNRHAREIVAPESLLTSIFTKSQEAVNARIDALEERWMSTAAAISGGNTNVNVSIGNKDFKNYIKNVEREDALRNGGW